MIEHTAFASRCAAGFIGVFTYPKGGIAHTERVRNRDGTLRIFRSEVRAQAIAGLALCRALNASDQPRSPGAKVFTVRNVGGRSRLTAEANRVFSMGVAAE